MVVLITSVLYLVSHLGFLEMLPSKKTLWPTKIDPIKRLKINVNRRKSQRFYLDSRLSGFGINSQNSSYIEGK